MSAIEKHLPAFAIQDRSLADVAPSEQHCPVCEAPLRRRESETLSNFSKRQTCGAKSCIAAFHKRRLLEVAAERPDVFRRRSRSASPVAETTARTCALDGCANELPQDAWYAARYCSRACRNETIRRRDAAAHDRRSRRGGRNPQASTAIDPVETRQRPIRPDARLQFDPGIIIRPARPAPVRRYTSGRPTPFQDDLNAILDYGSPGSVSRASFLPSRGSSASFAMEW